MTTVGYGMTRDEAIKALALAQDLSWKVTGLDKQSAYLAKNFLSPVPCPNCSQPVAAVDAIVHEGDHCECPHCHALIRYVVPLVHISGPFYLWDIEPGQIAHETRSLR
jgi:hypothetical protein